MCNFYLFFRIRRGSGCLYCPHVLGGREACLGGRVPFAVFFAWAGKFLHCFRGGAVGVFCMGGLTRPYIFRIIISGIKRFKYKACDAGKTAVY